MSKIVKPSYELFPNASFDMFFFKSEGKRGSFTKAVVFGEIDIDNVYRIQFGDYDKEKEIIDDFIITNNGDTFKVLTTIAVAMELFLKHYPEAWLHGKGASDPRTRLNQMTISNHLEEFKEVFGILGQDWQGKWTPFERGKKYGGFLITSRENYTQYIKKHGLIDFI